MTESFVPDSDQICSGYAETEWLKSQGMNAFTDLYEEAHRGITEIQAEAYKNGWQDCYKTIQRDAYIDWVVAEPPTNPPAKP